MDFHSLSRKELQTLCKKNKIPANITNVAMADALSALPQVEGLDEFLNPTEAEVGAGTPDTTHRTACRTATRRKALREEPQSAKVVSSQRPQHKTRGGNGEEGGVAEQENKDANVVPVTPAARRRATAVSTRRSKKEAEVAEDDEEKKVDHGKPADVTETPAAVPRSRTRATGRSVCPKTNGTSVQRGYNTRRSVRMLEKNLSKMSMMDAEDTGLGKNDDVSEEVSSVSQQIEDSADTEEVCDAGISLQTVSNVVLEEADEVEVSSLEKKSESECQVHISGSEVHLVSGTEIDVGAGVEADPQEEEAHDSSLELEGSSETDEISVKVLEVSDVDMNNSIEVEAAQADNKAGSELLSFEASEDASMEFAEQDVAALIVDVAGDAPVEVTYQDDAASFLPMSPVSDDSAQLKEVPDVDGKNNEAEHLNVADDNNIQHFEQMTDVHDKAEDEKDLASPEGVLELGSSDIYLSGEHQEEESEVKSENSEKDSASSAVASEKDNANANSEDTIDAVDVCVESSSDKSAYGENITLESPLLDDLQEELEAKSMGEVENVSASEVTMGLEKDASASSENSVGVMEVCTESPQSSLVDVGAEGAEAEKDNLEAEAQPQESNEQVAKETILDGSGFNSHTLVEGDAVSSETVTVAPMYELKASDIPMQQPVPKVISVEENMQNANMKENLTTDELHKKSMRELKMMLKKLSLDGKSNCKSKTNNNNVVKEVERKRTALQALPENQMTKGAASSE